MIDELSELSCARAHLNVCRELLSAHRRLFGESGTKIGRLTKIYETHILQALDRVWRAQCRAVFEDHGDGWFDTPACAQFVNNVDWEATSRASANLARFFKGVIIQREPIL